MDRYRRAVRALAAIVVACFLVGGTTSCDPPREPNWSHPIVFIHGWSFTASGMDCQNIFGGLEASLRRQGFTGTFDTIGYYRSDTNCDHNLQDIGNVNDGSSWRELGQVLSGYMWDHYTQWDIPVDIVGHSMGGLIARSMMQGTAWGNPGYSAPLGVEDVVTLGTPHEGAAWYSYLCLWGQCAGLSPASGDLAYLHQNGSPQGKHGTDWSLVGSTDDQVVPSQSAMGMFTSYTHKTVYSGIQHDDYMNNAEVQAKVGHALAYNDN